MTTHDEHTEGIPTYQRDDYDTGNSTGDLRSERAGSAVSVDPSDEVRHGGAPAEYYDDAGNSTSDVRSERAGSALSVDPSHEVRHDEAPTEYGDGGRHTEVGDAERPRPETSEWESSADPAASSATGDSPDTPRTEAQSSSDASLFEDDELAGWRARWDHVQAGFVDDPKDCVQKADSLVSDVVSQLTSGFTDARARLEQQWGRGQEASTEDLRLALKRYREFFERLLAV